MPVWLWGDFLWLPGTCSDMHALCRTEEDAAGMLANMSQSSAVLAAAAAGQDPIAAGMQAGQGEVKPPNEQVSSFSAFHARH